MNMEISQDFSGCTNVHQIIVKGKRAKRPRPSSSASSAAAAAGGNSNSLVSSPATSSSTVISTNTEEDEDMANCLILLAQGGGGGSTEGKFSSRRFPEMAAAAAEGKVGVYVYECKTCSRTFPSFQALGGHRASHKKPKPPAAAVDVDRKKPPPPAAAAAIDRTAEYAPAPPSTQFPKTHECSICGSEFASGQALGGHMRRHRSTNTASSDIIDAGEKTRNMLELDLNLPAPPEDDRREMKFHRFTPNKQPRLVFSAAALVDCHY